MPSSPPQKDEVQHGDSESGKAPNFFSAQWPVCGRRAGKSFVMALVAVFLACFRDYRPFLGQGERARIVIVAADRKQARTVMRYAEG